MKWKLFLVFVLGLAVLGLTLAACGGTPEPCPECPACPECPVAECPACPEAPAAAACPECPTVECPACPEGAAVEAPFADLWAGSAHADAEAEAFVHWDGDDPAVVPARCAKCHSEGGFLDFLGADGTAAGVVDNDAAIGTVVSCIACHNEATMVKSSVVFPSGAEMTGLGPEAVCMECHQGRASKASVDGAIANAGLEDMDAVSADLGFTNIHYYVAAVSMYGKLTAGGYEYEGKAYDAKFDHVAGYDSCVGCHNSHTLALKAEGCATCHTESDPKDIRMAGSLVDYDGDGDMEEGIYYEIESLQGMLYQAIQAYAAEVPGAAILYDASRYPYFFHDANANGVLDEGEGGYAAWTGRLAKAAYNYQTSLKDPGAYAHGGKYVIQLLYDSIENLNEALSSPVDLSAARRIDHGHFAGSEPAFRYWDQAGVVPATCATCHSAAGLPFQLTHGVQIGQPSSNGLDCASCHNDVTTFSIYEVATVKFPSGAEIDSGNPATNLCLNCHQGRSSTASVAGAIAGREADTVIEGQRFINIHYFAAGATLYGSEVQGAYQYEGKEYVGRFAHVEAFSNCSQCHNTHMQTVEVRACGTCHPGVASAEDLAAIRLSTVDFDGDGDTAEGIAGEIATMSEALYAAMQEYASSTVGTGIVYNPARHPYFFDEAGEGFASWTPRLLKAAYNYQYAQKDPGAFAHNPKYVIQFLYDSLEDIGADVSGMTRP
jgi:hypothetical protein